MDREHEDELKDVLRRAFPKAFKRALPIAVQLAEQNFDLTLKLITALKRRTRAEIEAREAEWEETLDKRDARYDAVVRAIETLKLKPFTYYMGAWKWRHGAQKEVKAHVLRVDGIDVSNTWLSLFMRNGRNWGSDTQPKLPK
jgi:hypothetical protein